MNIRNLIHLAVIVVATIGLLLPGVARADDGNPPAQKIIKTMEISVDKGCGATYYEGDKIKIEVSVPEDGWLTIWQEVDGDQYLLSSPKWISADHDFDISGIVQPPLGQEKVIAEFQGKSGHYYTNSCHYYTTSKQQNYAELKCEFYMPKEVHSGEEFEIEVKVWNSGNVKAQNVMLYGTANPKGYFQIESCSPNCKGTTTSLGIIKPNKSKWASYWVTAPHDKAGNFTFAFWVEAHNGVEAYCGWHDISVLGGQFFKVPPQEQE